MRWLLRLVIFWAIAAPLFYFFGIPAVAQYMTTKIRTQAYDQCRAADTGLTADKADKYCHCVSDGLIFTKADLMEMIPKSTSEIGQQKQPTALTKLAQDLANTCNAQIRAEQMQQNNVAPATQGGITIDLN